MERFTFLSLNASSSSQVSGLLHLLELHKPHVVLLQELTVTTEQLQSLVGRKGYKAVANIDELNQSKPGTGLVWKSELDVTEVTSLSECRCQSLRLGNFVFFNIYAPSGGNNKAARREFFGSNLLNYINGLDRGLVPVLGGDFNCVLDAMDCENNFQDKKCPALNDLVSGFSFCDAFRFLHPELVDYTFVRPNCSASRLDRFYVPAHLTRSIVSVTHGASVGDHKFVKMEFEIMQVGCEEERAHSRSPYWKLNVSILKNEDFLPNFKQLYADLKLEINNYNDYPDWWDKLVKPRIKVFCINVSTVLAMARRDTKSFLYACLNTALDRRRWEEVARLRCRIRTILAEEAMGLVVRSRYKGAAEAERASLFHMNREQKNAKKNNLSSLMIDGKVTTDRTRIEEKVKTYFNALLNGHHDRNFVDTGKPFETDFVGLPSFLEDLSKLSTESGDKLVLPLTITEVEYVIKNHLDTGRSPGLDGLPYEFFRDTWSIIGSDFTRVLQEELSRCALMESDRHGATRLLSKVDDVPAVDELRPITLLNCDYRILAKCLVRRLMPCMSEVIKSGQLCTNNGKNILFGITSIISSLDYVNRKRVAAFLSSYDMFKAYDHVFLKYLEKVMLAMNFPCIFVDWVLMLHEGATTSFILDFLTDPIKIAFSIRQGCPIAMLLYIIYIEPLLIAIRKHAKGIKIAYVAQCDVDFCDDVNVISEDEDDLIVIERIFTKFEAVSGALLSRSNKTRIMGLGLWRGRTNWPLSWIKVVEELNIFGFQVSPTYELTLEKSWEKCLSGFKKTLFAWGSRILDSLRQRVEVLKVFATSKLWYKASAIPLPERYAAKFESEMIRFLWRGKLEKLALDEVKNEVLAGGLGLPCVRSKADALFLKQTLRMLVSGPGSGVYDHISYWIGMQLRDYFPDMAYTPWAVSPTPYFEHMWGLLQEALVVGDLMVEAMPDVTSKEIYKEFTCTFPPPKVIYRYEVDWDVVWLRLNSPILSPLGWEGLFMIVHNIVPNRDRLYEKFNMANSPACDRAECAGERQDNAHLYTGCVLVREAWCWLRRRLLELLPQDHCHTSDFELINLFFGRHTQDEEMVWLLGNYVDLVNREVRGVRRTLRIEKMIGHFRQQLSEHQNARLRPLNLFL
jgi:exonuclease III